MARDIVDSQFTVGELVLPALFIVILISAIDSYEVQLVTLLVMWTLFIAIGVNAFFIGKGVQKKLAAKYGQDKVEKGVRWYAAMRSIQMRPMRLPKPQVKRGHKF
jgi:predicted branched-subunit amino acid permease